MTLEHGFHSWCVYDSDGCKHGTDRHLSDMGYSCDSLQCRLDAISETTIREALLERICGYVQKILVPYADSLLSISLEGPSRSDRQSSNGKHKDRDNPLHLRDRGRCDIMGAEWIQVTDTH